MNRPSGFAVATVLMMVVVMGVLLASYFVITNLEISTTSQSANSTKGFYAAEAGLNLRAQEVRAKFQGYNVPTGTSPTAANPSQACLTDANGNFIGSVGTGDFQCKGYSLQGRNAATYVQYLGLQTVDPIPPPDTYAGLSAQEYRYDLYSKAQNSKNETEAILQMRFKSRLVPLFQFAIFYNKDLEFAPSPPMTLTGPVHTNGNLFLSAGNSLNIQGRVTTAGDLYLGRKYQIGCDQNNPVRVADPSTLRQLTYGGSPCSNQNALQASDLSPFNGSIKIRVDRVTVPTPETFAPTPGAMYWDNADLRLVLNIATGKVEVRNQDNSVNTNATTLLNNCPSTTSGRTAMPGNKAVGFTNRFRNNRETATRGTAVNIQMLEVDEQAVMDCIRNNPGQILDGGKALDDTTNGGLVWHLSVDGPNKAGINNYGVRIRNGATLGPSSGSTQIRGLTLVTDQAAYIQGDYNTNNWKPAAIMADSINVLSNAWDNTLEGTPSQINQQPSASPTSIYSAFLSGTDSTGGSEGTKLNQSQSIYNGGVENYPRFHENWSRQTFTYQGSFVSLGVPLHVNGTWINQNPFYTPPRRVWSYETRFNNAANLPPLSPRFVYLKQELFVRQFEQQ